jgi:hypothetical protein
MRLNGVPVTEYLDFEEPSISPVTLNGLPVQADHKGPDFDVQQGRDGRHICPNQSVLITTRK